MAEIKKTWARRWKKWSGHALLVGMENGTITLEKLWVVSFLGGEVVSYKVGIHLLCNAATVFLILPKRNKSLCPEKVLHKCT